MAVYPSSIGYLNPVKIDVRYKTIISQFDEEGEENRKQKWLYPKRDVTLGYQAISKSEGETLWEFYCQTGKGAYGSFSWFEGVGLGSAAYNSYSSEYVGTGDSTTLIFNLPSKNSSGASHDVNINASVVSTSNYTMSFGGGGDGEDKITFVGSSTGGLGPPASSDKITCDFTGRLKIRCRFADDIFSFENFFDRLINTGVKLKGLLNS